MPEKNNNPLGMEPKEINQRFNLWRSQQMVSPYQIEQKGVLEGSPDKVFQTHGISLEAHFAGQALQGLMANPNMINDKTSPQGYAALSEKAWLVAKAMMFDRFMAALASEQAAKATKA